jgi:RNA polymerase sigma-70 factor (ECF subfamily)
MTANKHFASILIEQLPHLRITALHLTKDRSKAEDLLQDTLARIWSYRDKFEPGSNFGAWTNVVMRNLFINDYRKKKLHGGWPLEIKEDLTEGNEFNSGEQQLQCNDIIQEILQLEERYSRPILLRQQGYSYQEISDEMSVPVGTIKSRIHSARRYLRQHLSK